MKSIHFFLALLGSSTLARADFIGSPLAVPNSSTATPFFVTNGTAPSVRYQQVYNGSDFQFQGHGNSQFLITGMSFTAGSGGGPTEVTIPSLQIDFSTT